MSKTTKKAIEKLGNMKVNELQARFAEVTGETTRSPNKTFLIRRITEALQAAAGETKTTKAKGTPEFRQPMITKFGIESAGDDTLGHLGVRGARS